MFANNTASSAGLIYMLSHSVERTEIMCMHISTTCEYKDPRPDFVIDTVKPDAELHLWMPAKMWNENDFFLKNV